MDAELKAKWVAALRSGEYQQARGVYYKNGAYCCLGVLEAVATGSVGGAIYGSGFGNVAVLPAKARSTLSIMNDRGAAFLEIADYIEANL